MHMAYIFLFSFEKTTVSLHEIKTDRNQVRGLQSVLSLPLRERRTLDVDVINVKGIMALLLAQQ